MNSSESIRLITCIFILFQMSCFFFKIKLTQLFATKLFSSTQRHTSWLLFLVVIIGFLMEDFSWISFNLQSHLFPTFSFKPILFILRLAWISNIIMYQAFSLFIESFTQNKEISFHQKIFISISGIVTCSMIGIIILHTYSGFRPPLELFLFKFIALYECLILLPVSFIYTLIKLRSFSTQRILKAQLQTLSQFFLIPYVCMTLLLLLFITPASRQTPFFLIFYQCSNIILTLAFLFTMRKIINLRFFNVHPHVHSFDQFNFTHDFKKLLEHLGSATNINEIKLLTQRFFSQAFTIAVNNIELVTRTTEPIFQSDTLKPTILHSNIAVEHFLQDTTKYVLEDSLITPSDFLYLNQILIYDEIEYDYYHTKNELHAMILSFLQSIQADAFIPIYEEKVIIAYIIVAHHARPQELYSDQERDEMVVFASYLGKVINLLQNRNLYELLKQRKEIIDELYLKHQEINKYKESIRSFLQHNQQEIGIIFFKNKKLVRANKEAYSILQINLTDISDKDTMFNMLETLSQEAILYKTTQTKITKNKDLKKIVLSAIPFNNDDVIITVHHPALYDLIKDQINLVQDPSHWDYLLYLETTECGKLINQLIPAQGEIFLNFKIELLQIALSKKALLLEAPEDDLLSLVELLHHMSLRETLYILELKDGVSPADYSTQLFGINYLFGDNSKPSLLEKLNKLGTLCIKNIERLSLDAQDNLAQFIRYGFYTIYKSEKRTQSDVRIICTSHKNLALLVQEGKFSKQLFQELQKTTLVLPSLLTLPDIAINQLVDGFTELALSRRKTQNNILLSETEKQDLTKEKPVSLQELKQKIQHMINENHKKDPFAKTLSVQGAYSLNDPHFHEIALLGKNALKDPRLLNMLWNKFQNQNQIALFLGVNRSSVHRRCKEYNII